MRTDRILLVLLVLALGIRLFRIDTQELGIDEMLSTFEANGLSMDRLPRTAFTWREMRSMNDRPGAVAANLELDSGNGIIHTWIMHNWVAFTSNEVFFLRLPSVLLGTLLVWLVHRLSLLLFNNRSSALMTGFLVAICPHLVDYSQEVRQYMLATVFCAVSTIALYRILRSAKVGSHWYCLFALSCAGAVLSHYSTVYILMVYPVIVCVERPGRRRNIGLVLAAILAIGLCSIWFANGGIEGLSIISERNSEYVQRVDHLDPDLMVPGASVTDLLKGWGRYFIVMTGVSGRDPINALPYVPLLILWPFALILALIRQKKSALETRSIIGLSLLAVAAPVFATILSMISGHTVAFVERYALFSTPFVLMLLGHAMAGMLRSERSSIGRFGRGIVVLHLMVMLYATAQVWRGTKNMGPNMYAERNTQLERAIGSAPQCAFRLVHGSRMAALVTGLYLNENSWDLSNTIGVVPCITKVEAIDCPGVEPVLLK